jgi:hypothetical protein
MNVLKSSKENVEASSYFFDFRHETSAIVAKQTVMACFIFILFFG